MKLIAALALAAGPALADCPPPVQMQEAAQAWLSGERLPDPGVATVEDAACAYAPFRAALEAEMGAPVGWKVGFTSKPAQERFGVTAPVAGALFAPMILQDGAEVSLTGSRSPFYEADLIVTVRDAAINDATTREQVAASLSDVRPFIELPDMALAEGVKPTGPIMASYGVIPWRGVIGQGVAMADLSDPVADLAALTVTLQAEGAEPVTGTGEMLLGHPLDVVLWLIGHGDVTLEPGQMISLGSLSPLVEAKPGLAVTAEYLIGGRPMRVAARLVQ
ncbi:2-keto-4-pentenoate hydratase [Paracoccus sp. (in: a-proteobacteria)]|uniref:2-keto-4-pentenoate hydratase n=1 Tax=Paracoccus sp. TaxID=267 RepID=UPI0026E0D001|nr:hydratase [Paracoccus sp. (in: a-proteobacteria)]MDO5370650.1 hydratase [Paracoccus sp. (in: a-proteobacteria)]